LSLLNWSVRHAHHTATSHRKGLEQTGGSNLKLIISHMLGRLK